MNASLRAASRLAGIAVVSFALLQIAGCPLPENARELFANPPVGVQAAGDGQALIARARPLNVQSVSDLIAIEDGTYAGQVALVTCATGETTRLADVQGEAYYGSDLTHYVRLTEKQDAVEVLATDSGAVQKTVALPELAALTTRSIEQVSGVWALIAVYPTRDGSARASGYELVNFDAGTTRTLDADGAWITGDSLVFVKAQTLSEQGVDGENARTILDIIPGAGDNSVYLAGASRTLVALDIAPFTQVVIVERASGATRTLESFGDINGEDFRIVNGVAAVGDAGVALYDWNIPATPAPANLGLYDAPHGPFTLRFQPFAGDAVEIGRFDASVLSYFPFMAFDGARLIYPRPDRTIVIVDPNDLAGRRIVRPF